ncbi:hypothetical protein [Hirschia baltica]|uniref:Uncharacterized protein n=1 Tax=Hirschia baltica (strain ATCC 49814 / DSM 5838 / IFAM 1418) TaxID=582402 RepID=C6XKG2_HIRBI|nr:hypothetical protein [Hirschia baltica]ACT57760.1 hypothetical protein Hbal_0058 [Hirschia baltica ATCC 49814]
MLKNIKTIAVSLFAASIATIGMSSQTAQANDVQDFLSEFNFETGRVLIIAPDGVRPSADWSIRFSADFGSRKANSTPIVIDYALADQKAVKLPANVSEENAYMLAVQPELSIEANQTRADFVGLSKMDGADEVAINMQLGASFKIADDKQANVCAANKIPTPVDVWIKPSDDADWQRLSDMENLWKFGFFLRSAINSACPTI